MNDKDGQLIIKEEEAEIVRRIFTEYLNGKGTYIIAKGLNNDNITTIRTADQWTDTAVIDILQILFMQGFIITKTYTTEVLPFQRKEIRERCLGILLRVIMNLSLQSWNGRWYVKYLSTEEV